MKRLTILALLVLVGCGQQITGNVVGAQPTLMQQLLEDAPSTYWYKTGDTEVIAVGDKRVYQSPNYDIPNVHDTATNEVALYAGDVPTPWWNEHTKQATKWKDRNEKYPAYFKVNLAEDFPTDEYARPYYPGFEKLVQTKSPVDVMKTYAYANPVDISTQPVLLPSENTYSAFSLTYLRNNKPGTITLHMHPTYRVPLLVEERNEQGAVITRTDYDFDQKAPGEIARKPITQELAQLPDNHVTVNEYDWQQYRAYADEQKHNDNPAVEEDSPRPTPLRRIVRRFFR